MRASCAKRIASIVLTLDFQFSVAFFSRGVFCFFIDHAPPLALDSGLVHLVLHRILILTSFASLHIPGHIPPHLHLEYIELLDLHVILPFLDGV